MKLIAPCVILLACGSALGSTAALGDTKPVVSMTGALATQLCAPRPTPVAGSGRAS